MKKTIQILPVLLVLLLLTACRIDLSVNGNGMVLTEHGSFDCSTGNSGDCVQNYVNDVTLCPNYVAPTPPALATIPANCTVLVATETVCASVFANGEEWVNCIPDSNGVAEVFHALANEGSEFAYWGGDDLLCNGQTNQNCMKWISPDDAGTDSEVTVEANFTDDVVPATATYTYNHLGQRKSKTVGGVTTYFVYSDIDGQMLGEYKADGAPIRQYLYAEGERMAMFTYDYSTTPATKAITYFANNHIGQTVAAWDAAGNQSYERNQTPFGETKGEFGANGTKVPLRFPGQYYDAESGFNDNWNRTYDPSIGRYLQSDPIGLGGGINTYGYANQSPVMNADPEGLSYLSFNGATGQLCMYDRNGNRMFCCGAANNVTSGSRSNFPGSEGSPAGHWPAGNFPYITHTTHRNDSPNSEYGSHGALIFDVPNHTGMGVHSGRQNNPDGAGRSGPDHATQGCIRTDDDCMRRMLGGSAGDPITGIQVSW